MFTSLVWIPKSFGPFALVCLPSYFFPRTGPLPKFFIHEFRSLILPIRISLAPFRSPFVIIDSVVPTGTSGFRRLSRVRKCRSPTRASLWITRLEWRSNPNRGRCFAFEARSLSHVQRSRSLVALVSGETQQIRRQYRQVRSHEGESHAKNKRSHRIRQQRFLFVA